jgi:hypothetical protein
MALTTASLALLDCHLASGSKLAGIAAALCLSLGILAKATFGVVLLPIAILYASRHGTRAIFSARFTVAVVLTLAPIALWTVHAHALNIQTEVWPGTTVADLVTGFALQAGRLAYFASAEWYAASARLFVLGHGFLATLLAIAGLAAALFVKRHRPFVLAWAAGALAYAAAFPGHVASHPYYALAHCPLTAYLAGVAALEARRILPSPAVHAAALSIAVGLVAWTTVPGSLETQRRTEPDKIAFGEVARRVVPENAALIVQARILKVWDGALLYQARRRGWRFSAHVIDPSNPSDMRELEEERRRRHKFHFVDPIPPSATGRAALSIERLEELRGRGAQFFAYFGPPAQWLEEQGRVARYVLGRYAVVAISPRWVFVDLRAPCSDLALDPVLGDPVRANGFELAGSRDAEPGERGSGQRLLAWKVVGAPSSEPPREGFSAPCGGLVPATALERGMTLVEKVPAARKHGT